MSEQVALSRRREKTCVDQLVPPAIVSAPAWDSCKGNGSNQGTVVMRFRSAKQIKQDFLNARTGQSEADFLTVCGVRAELEQRALRVRAAIANLAGVDVCHIHADDKFDSELTHFDFWGSLDSIELVLELEESLDVRISDEQAHEIPDPESVPALTVADWVRRVVKILTKE